MSLGEYIRAHRKAAGITQAGLAAAMGWRDRITVSQLENGKRGLQLSELMRLARTLGVDPQEIMEVVDG